MQGVEVKRSAQDVVLTVDAREIFLPLVTTLVEKSTYCFGFGKDEALDLTLAAEEVFMHLCRVVMPAGGPLGIRCSTGVYYMQIVFSFPARAFDMRAFNLTATVSLEDDADLESMGLIIASRSVDRFLLSREGERELRLSLIKEKPYPKQEERLQATVRPVREFGLRAPKPEEVKFICKLALASYESRFLSELFVYPGKLADMIATGEYEATAAVGPAGEIAGAILWHRVGGKVVECFGPYVFNEDLGEGIAEALLEGCIGAIARTPAVGLINTRPTLQLPGAHFEKLGTLTVYGEDGSSTPLQAWFRLMREDTGSTVWVHPELSEFLEHEYRRLVLPRDVRVTRNLGEGLAEHSVLSTEFDRLQRRATLRPMWPGADAEKNIVQHVGLLKREGIPDVLFAMDLGKAWQTDFTPGLLRQRFEPCFVLPYAGEGDVIIFQLRGEQP